MRASVRYAGYLVLGVAAVAVFVVLGPKIDTITPTLPTATSYESLITSALDADTANNLRTAGAPQQQVVNGWTAKDLLTSSPSSGNLGPGRRSSRGRVAASCC